MESDFCKLVFKTDCSASVFLEIYKNFQSSYFQELLCTAAAVSYLSIFFQKQFCKKGVLHFIQIQ